MPSDARAEAIAHLRQLRDCLQSDKSGPELAPLVEECEQLIRSVETFHMEAIRFRVYGLHRRLTSATHDVPEQAGRLIENVRQALQAAGFQTR